MVGNGLTWAAVSALHREQIIIIITPRCVFSATNFHFLLEASRQQPSYYATNRPREMLN